MKRKLTLLLLLLTLGVLAVGCGVDKKSDQPTPPKPIDPNPPVPPVVAPAEIIEVDFASEGVVELDYSGAASVRKLSFEAPEAWTANLEEIAASMRTQSSRVAAAATGAPTWITVDPMFGPEGPNTITITILANTGAERAVEITIKAGDKEVKLAITQVNATTAADLLELGDNALKDERYDKAISFYDEAYNMDNRDTKAIIYSALGKIAKISTSPKVIDLLRNRFGFTSYPNQLNALINEDWLQEYPKSIEDEYYDATSGTYVYWHGQSSVNNPNYPGIDKVGYYAHDNGKYTFISDVARYTDSTALPELVVPDWLEGNENSWYNKSLLGGTSKVASMNTWIMLLCANLLNSTDGDMNVVIDETIAAVFGDSFNAALARVNELDKTKTITLDKEFVDALHIGEYIDEYDHIGWAEVNAITSAMKAMKASLEWVSAYNLNMDLGFMKYAWERNSVDFIDLLKKELDPNDLPINSDFMEARTENMEQAKADFLAAIQGLQASYDVIFESPIYPSVIKDAYPNISTGIGKIVTAIETGGKVWIPKDPTKGTWPTAGGNNVLAGVDMGKFFEGGYLAPKNLFVLENGKPVFFAGGVKLTPENYATQLDKAQGIMGIQFNKKTINDLVFDFPKLYEKVPELKNNKDFIRNFVTANVIHDAGNRAAFAKLIFEKYYGIDK